MEGNNTINPTSNEIYIGANELVFNNETGIQSGGFSIPDIMNKAGISPVLTINSEIQSGGGSNKVSDLFQHLAVPNWATMYNMSGGEYKEKRNKKKYDDKSDSDSDSDINDDLHDRLLELVKEHDHEQKLKQKQKKTRRTIKGGKKNTTKRNKKK